MVDWAQFTAQGEDKKMFKATTLLQRAILPGMLVLLVSACSDTTEVASCDDAAVKTALVDQVYRKVSDEMSALDGAMEQANKSTENIGFSVALTKFVLRPSNDKKADDGKGFILSNIRSESVEADKSLRKCKVDVLFDTAQGRFVMDNVGFSVKAKRKSVEVADLTNWDKGALSGKMVYTLHAQSKASLICGGDQL